MQVFNNRQRSGYKEIVSYGPGWWPEFREMDAIYRFGGWTLDLMAYQLECLINNQFPAYADLDTTALFEKLLGITPEPNESLEERRKTVAAYYFGDRKLSRTAILGIIESYTGCEGSVTWLDRNILRVRIYPDGDFSPAVAKIADILERRKPAHIAVNIDLYREMSDMQYIGAYTGVCACVEVWPELVSQVDATAYAACGGGGMTAENRMEVYPETAGSVEVTAHSVMPGVLTSRHRVDVYPG